EHVQGAVRPLAHAANAGVQLGQQPLFADDALTVEYQADECAAHELGDEEIVLPRGKELAFVEGDARRGDVRRPEIDRLLHAFLRRLVFVDRLARVLAAVADRREAVVLPLLDGIDFVAAARPVLARPQLAGAWMNRDALDVAKPEGVDFRMRAGSRGERVVLR